MKRVGNKSAQLVRSASRRRKTSSRFQFDITVERVFGTKAGLNYQLKWSRGVKVASTSTKLSTKQAASKSGLVFDEKLSLLVTLYKEDGKKFDLKDAKLALIAVNQKKQMRTAAKIHFDLSQFAGVPSASVQKLLKLSDSISVKLTIESRFLKSAAKGAGSAGASSALSGVSARSSDDFDDDFDDLAVDDVPEPEVLTASSVRTKRAPPMCKQPPHVSQPAVPSPSPPPASSSPTPSSEPAPSGAEREPAPKCAAAPPAAAPTRGARAATVRQPPPHASPHAAQPPAAASARSEQARSPRAHARELQQQAQQLRDANARCSASQSALDELRADKQQLERDVLALRAELQQREKRSHDELQRSRDKLSASERKCAELSRELDGVSIGGGDGDGDGDSQLQQRLLSVASEKEQLESRIKGHETHALKVKSAYEKLSHMYNTLRDDNMRISKQLEQQQSELLRVQAAAPLQGSERDAHARAAADELRSRLERALQQVDEERALKEALQARCEQMGEQLREAREQCDANGKQLQQSGDEMRALRASVQQLSKAASAAGNGAHERDASEGMQRLQSEMEVLREDIEYERGEKVKAREERDKAREHARQLERKTSQAAKQTDELHALRRQLSTQQMRDKEHADMIGELRAEVRRLRQAAANADAHAKEEAQATHRRAGSGDDFGEVLQELVAAKLALAQAEDDKLNLQFSMKQVRKTERMAQQRLAAHASRLEVKLGQACEELHKLRKDKKLPKGMDARDWDELHSDIDY